MTGPEIDAVVAKLTKAQREAVQRGWAWSLVTARALMSAGIIGSFARHTGENFVAIELTLLGLLVRARLMEGSARD